MTRDELITQAHEALEMAREGCFNDPATHSHPDRAKDAAEAYSLLEARLEEQPPCNNPCFRNQDEMTAALIILAVADPDTYRSVVQFAYPEFTGDLSTVDGALMLERIARDLGDDHDLCIDVSGDLPVLGNEAYFPVFVRGATPRSLLEAIRPLAEIAVSAHPSPR